MDYIPYADKDAQLAAEEAKALERQRDRWQEERTRRMDQEPPTSHASPLYRSGAGLFSTDNPQSDDAQIRAESGS